MSRLSLALAASLWLSVHGVHVTFDAAARVQVLNGGGESKPAEEVASFMRHLQEEGFRDLGWDADVAHFNRVRLLASQARAKTVCTTGFGSGVSAMAFLSADPRTTVVSFDAGTEGYVRPAEVYLRHHFGERLRLILGKRNETVLQQAALPQGARCDAAVVGGAHDWETAVGDIQNLKDITKPGGMVLVENCHPDAALRGRDKHDLHDRFKINFAYKAALHRGFLVHKSFFATAECLNKDDAKGFSQCRETCVAQVPEARESASGQQPLQEIAHLMAHLRGSGFQDLGYSADTTHFSRLRDLATLAKAKAVCITGSGSGVTALAFLSANPETVVYAFDGSGESYVPAAGDYLKEQFGEKRLKMFIGATDMVKQAPDARCDAAVVGSAHSTEAALADIKNLEAISKPGGYVLVENCHSQDDDSDAAIRGPDQRSLDDRLQMNAAYKAAQAQGLVVHKEFVYTAPCLDDDIGIFSSCRETAVGRFAGGPVEAMSSLLFDQ